MKRFVAGLMALVMLFTGMASAESQLPYQYDSIQITLSNLDEDAFRQWAYEKLSIFQTDYLKRAPVALYKEYYKLANYKEWYGSVFGLETNDFGVVRREIAYTDETMTEEQKDQMYLLMLLESLEEMSTTNKNYYAEYLRKGAKERKSYTVQMDGSLRVDPYLEAVAEQSDAEAAEAVTNFVVDAADLVVSSAVFYTAPDGADIAGSITKIATSTIKKMAKTISDNAVAKAENTIRSHMTRKILEVMDDCRAADMAALKEVYLSGNHTNARAVKVAQQLYDYYASTQCQNAMIAEASAAADKAMQEQQVMAQFGMELETVLETSEILIITVMEAVTVALNEVVDNLKLNSDGEEKVTKSLTSLLNTLLKIMCNNIQQNWIDTGSFSFSAAFVFDDDDMAAFWKEVNLFDMISDSVKFKEIIKDMNGTTHWEDHITRPDFPLPVRLSVLFLYYLFLELPEAAIDDIFDRNLSSKYIDDAYKSFKKNMGQFFNDLCSIVAGYCKDKVKVTISEQQNKLKEMRKVNKKAGFVVTEAEQKKLNKATMNKIKALNVAADVLSTVAALAEKAWNVGENLVLMYTAARDAATGEDEVSFLAEKVVTAQRLSEPLQVKLLGMVPGDILDKSKMSIADVWSHVSAMKKMAEHDATGANAYLNVDMKSAEYKNSDFFKILNGDSVFRYSLLHLDLAWITYDYINIQNERGLLPMVFAETYRNVIVNWANWTDNGFKDEWLDIPNILD